MIYKRFCQVIPENNPDVRLYLNQHDVNSVKFYNYFHGRDVIVKEVENYESRTIFSRRSATINSGD